MPITVNHGSPGSALGAKYAIGVSQGHKRLANTYLKQQKLNQGQDVLRDKQVARTRSEQREYLEGIHSSLPEVSPEGTQDPMTLNRLREQKQAIFELTHSPDYDYTDQKFRDRLDQEVKSYQSGVAAASRDPRVVQWENQEAQADRSRRDYVESQMRIRQVNEGHSLVGRFEQEAEEKFPRQPKPLTAAEMERKQEELEFQQSQGEARAKEAEARQKAYDDRFKVVYAGQPDKGPDGVAAADTAAQAYVDSRFGAQAEGQQPPVPGSATPTQQASPSTQYVPAAQVIPQQTQQPIQPQQQAYPIPTPENTTQGVPPAEDEFQGWHPAAAAQRDQAARGTPKDFEAGIVQTTPEGTFRYENGKWVKQ